MFVAGAFVTQSVSLSQKTSLHKAREVSLNYITACQVLDLLQKMRKSGRVKHWFRKGCIGEYSGCLAGIVWDGIVVPGTEWGEKNFLKHHLTQKLLESIQGQIEKATAAFMLQDSIVLILGQLYQIILVLETHVRRKICWKAA